MPYILGALIVVLVCVIIVSGVKEKSNEQNPNNNAATLAPLQSASETGKQSVTGDETNLGGETIASTDKNNGSDATPVSEPASNTTPAPTAEPVAEPTSAPVETKTPDKTTQDLTFGYTFESKADYVDTKSGINLRLGCSTDTERVAYLETGKRLERTGYNSEWTRVIYDGQECYLATRLIIDVVDSIDDPYPED